LYSLLERLENPLVAVTAVLYEAALTFVVAAASLDVVLVAVASAWAVAAF
jgi:hypothetical protein